MTEFRKEVKMRIPLIAGNWKMNKTRSEAEDFIKVFKAVYKGTDVRALICAPYTLLETIKKQISGTDILLGAQNVFYEPKGAFTGEISITMLEDIGVDYAIVGHSERREYFNEDDTIVNLKVKALLKSSVKPILCVGEPLEKRESGEQDKYVVAQVRAALEGVEAEKAKNIVVAYEPIWAIGTGRTATAAQAGEMCGVIRSTLIELYDEDIADEIIIQYGGSVSPDNITDIMDMPEIDGALVGGASLEAEKFMSIIDF